MGVRDFVRRSETLVGFARDLRQLSGIPARLAQLRRRRPLVEGYLASHPVRKLHLGAGRARLDGWLDTDLAPVARDVVYLDVRGPFPLPDAAFDYAYSEHMIEHVTWAQGLGMLRECRRVLRPGGRIRIATPDLEVFLNLHRDGAGTRGERYVRWVIDRYMGGQPAYESAFVVNRLFRDWGHRFIYDGDAMTLALSECGFSDIRRMRPGESDDAQLRGIESHGRIVQDEEMAAFETMVFEAVRPT